MSSMTRSHWAVFATVALAVAGVIGWNMLDPGDYRKPTSNALMHGAEAAAAALTLAEIVVPELSSAAQTGKLVFDAKCAICHGENAAGTKNGPPFLHKIYQPSHHADFAFNRAVLGGVRSHHWRFGDMPRIEGLDNDQIGLIVTYVRELQRANGIE